MDILGITSELESQIRAAHENTWIVNEGLPGALRTRKGVRPGDPWGSLVFNLLMATLLEKVQERLREHGIRLTLPSATQQDVVHNNTAAEEEDFDTDVSFVDDCALQVQSKDPMRTIEATRTTIQVVHAVFKEAALDLNFSKGKTECVMSLRGKGSRKAK